MVNQSVHHALINQSSVLVNTLGPIISSGVKEVAQDLLRGGNLLRPGAETPRGPLYFSTPMTGVAAVPQMALPSAPQPMPVPGVMPQAVP